MVYWSLIWAFGKHWKWNFFPLKCSRISRQKHIPAHFVKKSHSPHFIPSEVWIQPWVSRYISNSNHVILCASMFQQLIKTLPLTFTVCCWDPWTKMATNYTLTQTVSVLLQQNMGRNSGQEQTHTHTHAERDWESECRGADMQSDRHRERNKTENQRAIDRGTMWQKASAPRLFQSLPELLHQQNKLSSFTRTYVSRTHGSRRVHGLLCYLKVSHRSPVNKREMKSSGHKKRRCTPTRSQECQSLCWKHKSSVRF